ncbi:MAG: hypothetical protein GY811_06430, partial [Myxococcales bacterium]|nr:hypothetical protein [Myxococcales bacterium]
MSTRPTAPIWRRSLKLWFHFMHESEKARPRWLLDDNARMTPDLAREMLAAFAASELSLTAFARLHEIPKQRLCYWRQRIALIEAAQKPRLVESTSR